MTPPHHLPPAETEQPPDPEDIRTYYLAGLALCGLSGVVIGMAIGLALGGAF